MIRFLRALSLKAEFTVVIAAAFGFFILTSFATLVFPDATNGPFSDEGLWSLTIYEVIVFAALWTFLRLRGWTLRQLGLGLDPKEALLGFALAFGGYLAHVAVWLVVVHLAWGLAPLPEVSDMQLIPLGVWAIVALSLVNPVFEETFVCAYVITALRERATVTTVIAISVGIRSLYHFYQGLPAVAGIAAIGVVFAYWYVRRGRLLPVIVAHALLDLSALLPYAQL